MPLSVGDALRDGLRRTFERNGLQLIGGFVGLKLVGTVAADTLTRAYLALLQRVETFPSDVEPAIGEISTPFALGVGVSTAVVLVVAVALLAEAVRIVAVRTLVSERVDTIPADHVRRNVGVATLNGFVGGLVVFVLSLIGLVALVVPGLFLAVSFLFVRQEIAVRDVNFVEAMRGSWQLAAGSRLELLALGAVVVSAELGAVVLGGLLAPAGPPVVLLGSAAVGAIVAVFGIASVSRAYVQLRDEHEEDADLDDTSDTGEEPDYEGALTADDLPPPEEAA